MVPSRFTNLKIALGYSLLLAVLLFTLVFIHREMKLLSEVDTRQSLEADSLLALLHEKDRNTLQMLQMLSEANDSLLSAAEIEEIISEQDSIITQQRVQHRVITRRDSLVTKPKKKGFFKRLAEVFAPSDKDSAVLINTSLELATDTILEPFTQTDSLQQKIRTATRQKRLKSKTKIRRTSARYQRLNSQLTAQMDSLIKGYEEEAQVRASRDEALQQAVRRRSTRIIGGIAVGAVLLSSVFLVFIWRDITRSNCYRRELEEANKRAEDLLQAREKLMLAITHDFKAPLGSIMGYTDLLARLATDERQKFYLDNMKSSSGHLLKLVSDLLDFHRLDLHKAEVNRVTFNPVQLFDEIRVSFEPLTAEKGLKLDYHIDPQLNGRFISDPLRIRQIVNNLLSNAVKFTSQGAVGLSVEYASSRLSITVADTGKGMAAEDKERIFQEFTRLPGAQGEEGFGLGLSIVHKLITLLEGDIRVESQPGEGSRFTVVLPLYPVRGEVPVADKNESEEAPIPSSSLRVLMIDDDKIQLNLTAAMLEQQKMEVTSCEQLEELIKQLQQRPFDVLLTDVQMPAINGFDLLKLLRASNIPQARTIPVIAVTARSEMDRVGFLEHGFAGCLHKPFTVKELLAEIGAHRPELAETEKNRETTPENGGKESVEKLNFRALTAFSEGDAEAASSILHTFIEETEKNLACMKDALAASDVNRIAAMAHKLLPLFTLIGAARILPLLTWLEACKEREFSKEMNEKAREALRQADFILEEARRYVQSASAGL